MRMTALPAHNIVYHLRRAAMCSSTCDDNKSWNKGQFQSPFKAVMEATETQGRVEKKIDFLCFAVFSRVGNFDCKVGYGLFRCQH
ncbi:hypothetical protein V6N13_020810 [Hibiscus sabdariffa]